MGDSCKYFAEGLVCLSCEIEDSEVEDLAGNLRSPLDGLENEDSECEGWFAYWLVYC